jgi:hypothetical protein
MVAVLEDGGSGTRNISGKRQFLTEKHGSCKLAKNVAKATSWQRHIPQGGRRSGGIIGAPALRSGAAA